MDNLNQGSNKRSSFTIVADVHLVPDYMGCRYKICKDKALYQIVSGYGEMLQVLAAHEVLVKEIEVAILEMDKHGHDSAHFGLLGGFMYTFDSFETEDDGRMVS